MLIQSVSPLTGETINTYETFSASHVDQIINKAYSNQENFRKLSISEISKLFANLYSVINSQKDTISQLIHNEVGKSLPDAQYMEVDDILTGINKYLSRLPSFKDAQKMSVDRNIFPDSAFGLMNQHVGVIGVIMPWNYPFWMPMSFIVPALMNGNPVVFKPSSYAIGVGLMIEGAIKVQSLGASMTLTGIFCALAPAAIFRFSPSSSVAAIAKTAFRRSPERYFRRINLTPLILKENRGATTQTSAPKSSNVLTFLSATAPPPTTRHFLPETSKLTG